MGLVQLAAARGARSMIRTERPGSAATEHGAGNFVALERTEVTSDHPASQDLAANRIARRYGLRPNIARVVAEAAGFRRAA